MNKPKTYPKIIAISNGTPIPFVTEEMLTAQAGHLVSEEVMDSIEAALAAAETMPGVAAVQALLDAANANNIALNANIVALNANLEAANTNVASLTQELNTTKTALTAAQEEAANWKAKAIEYGAKPGEITGAKIPGADAEDDDPLSALDNLPHNKRADQLLS